jgi:phosphoribosylformimino-5-aminoimidazole carboxamide ribotide isomerase
MEIIPAIDIIEGKCVRLTQGDYAQKKIYNENPLEVALQFQDAGLRRLHLVDLDGAKARSVKNWKVLEILATKTELSIDFGGGLNTEKDVQIVFDSGAHFATVGSVAVKNRSELLRWMNLFGAHRFLLGADVKDREIAIHGWTESAGRDIFEFLDDYTTQGIEQVFCTDIAKDGQLAGPSLELYKEIVERYPNLYFIASGGVSSLADLEALAAIPCSAAIVGKAIYENRITLPELKKFMENAY